MLKILFEDSPHLAAMSLPLLIYHPTQMFRGGILATYIKSTIFCTNTRYSTWNGRPLDFCIKLLLILPSSLFLITFQDKGLANMRIMG